jgi:hypothetical protein
MSNTIWHGLADEWERCTYEEDLSYSEMLIYDKCIKELRELATKWCTDTAEANEAHERREREYESDGRRSLVREIAKGSKRFFSF